MKAKLLERWASPIEVRLRRPLLQRLSWICDCATPQRYILIQRLEHARERLERSTATISRIAIDLAFANASQLASTFRARYGLTPNHTGLLSLGKAAKSLRCRMTQDLILLKAALRRSIAGFGALILRYHIQVTRMQLALRTLQTLQKIVAREAFTHG